jgi:integrase
MRVKLEPKLVKDRELAPGLSEEFLWDTDVEGFGFRLRRRPNGETSKNFVAQYRVAGKTRRSTIGAAAKLSLTQAREAARKVLAQATLGADPQSERVARRLRAAKTMSVVVNAYLASRAVVLRPSSLRVAKLYLAGPYFRSLQAVGIADITQADIAACLTTIAREHSIQTAAAARRWLSTLFSWAIEEGWVTANPVAGTRKPVKYTMRERVLNGQELAAVLRASDQAGEFGTVVKLLVLLGARRQEVGSMRWSELDLAAGSWTLPSERAKNKRSHTVVLPKTALEILRALPRKRDAVFGETENGFVSWGRSKAALDEQLPDLQPWRLHDIRRSVATGMAELGIAPHIVELVLAHAAHSSGVSGTYNRSRYPEEVRIALQRWDAHLQALPGTNVIQLRA